MGGEIVSVLIGISLVVAFAGVVIQTLALVDARVSENLIVMGRSASKASRSRTRSLMITVVIVTAASPLIGMATNAASEQARSDVGAATWTITLVMLLIALVGSFAIRRLESLDEDDHSTYSRILRDIHDYARSVDAVRGSELDRFDAAVARLQRNSKEIPRSIQRLQASNPPWAERRDEHCEQDIFGGELARAVGAWLPPRAVITFLWFDARSYLIPTASVALGGVLFLVGFVGDHSIVGALPQLVLGTFVFLGVLALPLLIACRLARRRLMARLSWDVLLERTRLECVEAIAQLRARLQNVVDETADRRPRFTFRIGSYTVSLTSHD